MQTNLTIASVLALACATGCHKQTAAADDGGTAAVASSAPIVAATAPDDSAAAVPSEVAPPDAVVAADPNIPVNEAVVGATQVPADYTADVAPPAQPVLEDQPARPEADDAWVPGYWWWSRPLHRYVWVGGAWRHPPPDQFWSPGRWNNVGGHYAWVPGYWGPHGYVHEVIDTAPPPMRVEVRPVAPGAEFVWTPGSYGWRGGRYEWNAGSWVRPPRAGVAWVEPRYVNTGGHYVLQPGRWDYPAEHRGVVYHPDINVRAGAHLKLEPVPATVIVAHERYTREAAVAVAHGAVRNERGVLIVPHATVVVPAGREHVVVEEHGRTVETPRVEEHVNVTVEHGRPVEPRAPVVHERVDVHVTAPVVTTQVRGRPEPRHR